MPGREQLREDIHFRVLRALEENPQLSQRELAAMLGVSLGKAHYCLGALVERGWIKIQNFAHNPNKLGYTYLLTPAGIKAKLVLTRNFLARKEAEFEVLQAEIARLRRSLAELPEGGEAESTVCKNAN